MAVTQRMTVEEFAAMPREGVWELIDGEPVEMTPSADRSGWIAGQIVFLLEMHVRSGNFGWVFPSEVGFVLFGDRATVRSPDAAYVRRERLPEFTDSFVPVAPDIALEVLSPSDRMAEAVGKVSMYLEAGVCIVWLVDPASRTVIVFRPDAAPRSLEQGDFLDGGDVLPGFQVPVAEIFG